jgi:hypothetical protein
MRKNDSAFTYARRRPPIVLLCNHMERTSVQAQVDLSRPLAIMALT